MDAIETSRIQATFDRFGKRFLDRVYTEDEQRYSRNRAEELAVRFAGKEAISKALGTGMRGISWRELEILNNRHGKPFVRLHGAARARAEHLGLTNFEISLTHSRDLAIAFVVATTD